MKQLLFCLALSAAVLNVSAQKSAVIAAFSKHQIDEGILDPKIRQAPEDLGFDLKYTSVANDKEKVTLARFDPSRSGDERWIVISVNGKEPSSSEIKKFRKTRTKANTAAGKVDEASMKIEKETEEQLVVSYKLDAASLPSEASFLKDCRNHLTINLKTKRLEQLQCLNEQLLKIKILKAEKLDLLIKYSYQEQAKRYLPDSEDLNLLIRMLGQLVPMETISEYSNYVLK